MIRRQLARLLGAAILIVVALALLFTAWPQIFGQSRTLVIAQVVSLRGLAAAVGLALVLALTLVALLAAPIRKFAASLAVMLLVFSLINVAVLSTRGFGSTGFQSANDNDVTVLSWNTLGDAPGAEAIAQLALDSGADIVALPETTRDTGETIAQLMEESGHPMAVFTTAYDEVSKAKSTTLLISTDLGEYSADESLETTAVLPTIVATPVDGTGPTIVAVHAVAPLPDEMDHWRGDLQWLGTACTADNVIMAGDFNSTLDHYSGLGVGKAALGTCIDAALASDNAAVGTWPTSLPALLGSPIDHVMATPNWAVTGMRVIQSHDGSGSDHRPILAQLSPAG